MKKLEILIFRKKSKALDMCGLLNSSTEEERVFGVKFAKWGGVLS
jgi:hypothetical protein